MIGIDGNRRISQVLARAVVSLGSSVLAGDGRQDKSGDGRRAHVVGGIGVSRSRCERPGGALAAKLNHFTARSAVAALSSQRSYQ